MLISLSMLYLSQGPVEMRMRAVRASKGSVFQTEGTASTKRPEAGTALSLY